MRKRLFLATLLLAGTTATAAEDAFFRWPPPPAKPSSAPPIGTDDGGQPQPALSVAGFPSEPSTVGEPISATFGASGLRAPVTYTAQDLPRNLSLSPDGVVSGTIAAPGVYDFAVTATDAAGTQARQAFRVAAYPPLPQVATAPAAGQTLVAGLPFSATARVVEGGAVTWSMTERPGTWLDVVPATGEIGGVPPQGTDSFAYGVTGTDAYGRGVLVRDSVTLSQPAVSASFPSGVVPGDALSVAVSTNIPSATLATEGGAPWLSASATSLAGVVPNQPGQVSFVVTASSVQARAIQPVTLAVSPVSVSVGAPTSASGGLPYSGSVAATPGTGWSYTVRNKPAWLSVNPGTGALSGTPAGPADGATGLVAVATRNGVEAASDAFSIVVSAPAPTLGGGQSLAVATQQLPNTTGACTAYAVTNGGGGAATSPKIAVTANATEFAACTPVATSTPVCSTSLAPGASCLLGMRLKATTAGNAKSGTAKVTATNWTGSLDVVLTGVVSPAPSTANTAATGYETSNQFLGGGVAPNYGMDGTGPSTARAALVKHHERHRGVRGSDLRHSHVRGLRLREACLDRYVAHLCLVRRLG